VIKNAILLSSLLALGVPALAQVPLGFEPVVVCGDELGWPATLQLVLTVKEETKLSLDLYSPGFDPSDYRAMNEMGDERYDGGDWPLITSYELLTENGEVLARKEYGLEEHRWSVLYQGRLPAGNYYLNARLSGNAKNTVLFRVAGAGGRAELVSPPGSLLTFNVHHVHGFDWQEAFAVEVAAGAPLRVGIYDGDGPDELRIRWFKPSGEVVELTPSGNNEWLEVDLEEAGEHRFDLLQPGGAVQVTNTVGFMVFPEKEEETK